MFSLTNIASNFTASIYMAPSNFARRSTLIRMIKEIDAAYRSSKHDTTNDLLRKYRDILPKRPFIDALKNRFQNSALIDFLKHPVDEASIRVPAKDVAEYLHHKSNENGFYLQMGLDKSEQAEMEDGKTWRSESTEYVVLTNIERVSTLLREMKRGYATEAITIPQGSDIQALYKFIRYGAIVELTWYSTETYRKVHSGAFFPYFHATKLDLTRYQIFKREDDSREADKDACITFTLKQSGKVSTSDIDSLKLSIFDKEIKSSALKGIAKRLNITIRLRYDARHAESVLNKGCDTEISIGLVANHYFLNELTTITKYTLEHYDDVKDDVKFPAVQNPKSHKKLKPLTSFQVIYKLFSDYKDTLLTPITMSNIKNKQTVEKLIDYDDLRGPKQGCGCEIPDFVDCYKVDGKCCKHRFCKVKYLLNTCVCKAPKHEFRDYGHLSEKKPFRGFWKKPENDPNMGFDIWFIDTETFVDPRLNYHVANALCAIKYDESSDTYQEFEFFGLDCVERFLDGCINKHSIIYAHNMAFDMRMIIDYISDLKAPIESGTKLKQIQGVLRRGKNFYHMLFKDSYSFLPVKLSAIPKMLDLPCGDKEVFPYGLINRDTYDKTIPVSQCREHIKVGLRKAFKANAIKIGAYDADDRTVDMKKYTLHYCMQDTRILAHGFIKFRRQIQEVCKLDILSRISLPQLADDYLKSRDVYADCFAFSGVAQDFIRRCCVGGRVMSASNQRYHIKVDERRGHTTVNGSEIPHDSINRGPVSDFDAVSLYPSSMAMLKGYVRGLPKVLTEKQIKHFEYVSRSFDAYYLEIEVLSHRIDRKFPLQSLKSGQGIRDFTNDIDGKRFYLDNIALADFIAFQGIKYRIIRGYYFNDGFNTRINQEIKFLFDERNRLKAEGNNLQNVYKLLMNASYGKLIQKPIRTSKTFVRANDVRKFVAQHSKFIIGYSKVNDDLFVVKQEQSIITHFAAPHIASHILSMSKRLMNRVICLAEDKGIDVYYQDTDSLHLFEGAIPTLAEAYRIKYGSELIGRSMCQFHSDFDVSEKGATNVRAVETIIVAKKVYIDRLCYTNRFGHTKYAHHIRIKGVPTQAVMDYSPNYLETYKRLFDGEAIEFNLERYCPLQIDTDYRARKNTRCISRKLRFAYADDIAVAAITEVAQTIITTPVAEPVSLPSNKATMPPQIEEDACIAAFASRKRRVCIAEVAACA